MQKQIIASILPLLLRGAIGGDQLESAQEPLRHPEQGMTNKGVVNRDHTGAFRTYQGDGAGRP